MADNILFQLQLDTKQFQAEAENAIKEIERLKQVQKDLKDSGQQNTVEFQRVSNELSRYKKELKDNTLAMQNFEKVQKDGTGSLNELKKALSSATFEYNNLSKSERENSARGKELQKTIRSISDTLKEKESAIGNNTRNVGNYQEAIQNAAKGLNIFGININQSISQLRDSVESFKAARTALLAQSAATQVATATTGGLNAVLRILKVVLISTGIGAIVVALGSLIAFLTTTEAGMDAVTKVTRPLAAVFQRLLGIFQELGGKIFGQFSKALNSPIESLKKLGTVIWDNIINRFKSVIVAWGAVKKAFTGDFSGAIKQMGDAWIQGVTGIENGTDKAVKAFDKVKKGAKQMGKEVVNAVAVGKQIDLLTKAIEDNEILLKKERARLNTEFDKQREIASNKEKSEKDRIKAAQEASRVQNELLKKETEHINMKIEKMKLEHSLSDESDEQKSELADLEAERINFEGEAAKKRISVKNLEVTARKETVAALKKQREEEARAEEVLQTLTLSLIQDAKEKELAIEKLSFEKKLEQNRENLQISSKLRLQIEEQLVKENALKIAEIEKKYADEQTTKRLESEMKRIELQLNVIKKGTAEEFKLRQQQLVKELEQKLLTIKKGSEAEQLLRDEFKKKQDALKAEQEETARKQLVDEQMQKHEAELIRLEIKGQAITDKETEIENARFEALKAEKLKNGESIELITAQHEAKLNEIKKKGVESRAAQDEISFQNARNMLQIVDNLGEIFIANESERSSFAKALALFNIGLDTAQAISKAVANAQAVGFPASIPATITSIVQITANIAKAKKLLSESKEPKATATQRFDYGGNIAFSGGYIPAMGGMIEGRSHSTGGVKFSLGNLVGEADGKKGEAYIVNTSHSPLLKALASNLNVMGGGKPFFNQGGVLKFQDGGFASRSITATAVSNAEIASLFSSQIDKIKIVASIEDIVEANERKIRIEDRVSI